MLSKRVCKLCWKRHHVAWTKYEDIAWKGNRLHCVKAHFKASREIPPNDCPYALEHLLTQK